jgi:carboxymethylenebutenolidase
VAGLPEDLIFEETLNCMRTAIAFSFIFFLFHSAIAQDNITLCQPGMHDKFVVMASAGKFKTEHPLPRVYVHTSLQGGKMTTFKCPDGTEAKGYLIEAKSKTNNWIFVFQEWWGLNDNIKRQSEELFNALGNVSVIALDMYDGELAEDRDTALKLIQAFRQERGNMIVRGAMDLAGKEAKIGTVGWCFGGSQSLMASLTAGNQAVACVIYYGMPVDDVEQLKKLKPEVLGIFATKDGHITPQVVEKFEKNMKAAGKKVSIYNYDADHGFANPSNPIFDKAATESAFAHTTKFFREKLK